jgi:threonine synthase
VRQFCLDCGADYAEGFHCFCRACGGMIDVEYDLAGTRLADSDDPYVRFAGLLPLREARQRLPRAAYTPLVHARRLGRELGLSALYLKNETVLPTRTTKDRMAAVSLAYLHERGVRAFCASSTGNSSTAFAHAIRAHPDMHVFLFSAESFVPRLQHASHAQVTHIALRDASFVEAAEFAVLYARRNGLVSEGGFFNPARREGLKLAFLEACDQAPGPIDWYVQAISSAMGVYGTFKGAKELLSLGRVERLPRLLCVQQESCAPMVRAFEEGSAVIRPEHVVRRPTGIAEAILRGDPTRAYPRVRKLVLESGGAFTAVSEAQIREARRMVEAHEDISPCFSASAAVAGLLRQVRSGSIDPQATIVVNLTGAERPVDETGAAVHWIERRADGWHAEAPGVLARRPEARAQS